MLKKSKCRRAAYVNLAHVGDIENAGMISGGKVFLNNSSPVLNRHAPSAEFNHLSAKLYMLIMDKGFEKQFHKSPLYSNFDIAEHSPSSDKTGFANAYPEIS